MADLKTKIDQIFEQVTKISVDVNTIKKDIKKLKHTQLSSNAESPMVLKKFNSMFPLETVDETLHFENKLGEKREYDEFTHYIKDNKGKDVFDTFLNVARRMFTNSVMNQFTINGTFNKHKFQVCENILSAHVEGIKLIGETTSLEEVKEFYRSYMKNAKCRLDKGRLIIFHYDL